MLEKLLIEFYGCITLISALTMKETTIVASHAYVEERISHLKMVYNHIQDCMYAGWKDTRKRAWFRVKQVHLCTHNTCANA